MRSTSSMSAIASLLIHGVVVAGLCYGQEVRGESDPKWNMDNLIRARSERMGLGDLKSVVVDMQRRGGRGWSGLQTRRRVYVIGFPGELWDWHDSRPTIFDLVVLRYSQSRRTLEGWDGTNSYKRRDQFAYAELRFLGLSPTCQNTVRKGEPNRKQGTIEVLVTTDCDEFREYVFGIDPSSMLPKYLETYGSPAARTSAGDPRKLIERIVYLEYDDGAWRAPKRIRWEVFFLGKRWYRSEYGVKVLINPVIREGFFTMPIPRNMEADAWKPAPKD